MANKDAGKREKEKVKEDGREKMGGKGRKGERG